MNLPTNIREEDMAELRKVINDLNAVIAEQSAYIKTLRKANEELAKGIWEEQDRNTALRKGVENLCEKYRFKGSL